jgi:predicted NUDIX family NTP pyrophosphohydrolase
VSNIDHRRLENKERTVKVCLAFTFVRSVNGTPHADVQHQFHEPQPSEWLASTIREASLPDLTSRRRSVSSAGILMYRRTGADLEVLLVHPGGPYWRKKDEGAWSIPKGEMDEGENAEAAARREFMEETGVALSGPLDPLGEIRQRGGKRVIAFAVEGDVDVQTIRSNTFEIEWPPKGGRMQSFAEIDRAEWFDLPSAQAKLLEGQRPLLDRLAELVNQPGTRPAP